MLVQLFCKTVCNYNTEQTVLYLNLISISKVLFDNASDINTRLYLPWPSWVILGDVTQKEMIISV
jgi:hypothetical protein